MKDSEWYLRQVTGLMMIVNESKDVSKEYLMEKLTLIRNGTGIVFHPVLETSLNKIEKYLTKERFTSVKWEQIKAEIVALLRISATKEQTIWYSALVSKMTTVRLDLERPDHREVLAHLLGDVSTDEFAANRPLLSALVIKKQGVMEPGGGFFDLARGLGKTFSDNTVFWQSEVQKVFDKWGA